MKRTQPPEVAGCDYTWVARIYDALGFLYSGRAMHRSKLWHVGEIMPGARVLYAGVGTGSEVAVALAEGNIQAVAIDTSREMLDKLQARLTESTAARLETRTQSIMDYRNAEKFDVIVANYFLNVFKAEDLEKVLSHLISLLKPQGKIVVADFRPHRRWNLLQKVYYYLPLAAFALLARNPFHPLYDYDPLFEKKGFKIHARRFFRIFSRGPRWIQSSSYDQLTE